MKPGDTVHIFLPSTDLTQPAAVVSRVVGTVAEGRISLEGSPGWFYEIGSTAFYTREEALEQACRYYHSHVKNLELVRRSVEKALKSGQGES
jgi:hypothetical protein